MKLKQVGLVLILFVGAGLAVAGCDVQSGLPSGASSLPMTSSDGLSSPIEPLASEETDCPDLEAFRFRTTSPGSIEDNVVKAWVKLIGASPDATSIRIWWNYGHSEGNDHNLDALPVTKNEDGTITVEFLAEHTYKDLTEETERTIRAELIIGQDGTHCARVRHITVAPPPLDPPAKKKKPGPCVFSGVGKAVGAMSVLCLES